METYRSEDSLSQQSDFVSTAMYCYSNLRGMCVLTLSKLILIL